jgi:hypothetical protein
VTHGIQVFQKLGKQTQACLGHVRIELARGHPAISSSWMRRNSSVSMRSMMAAI